MYLQSGCPLRLHVFTNLGVFSLALKKRKSNAHKTVHTAHSQDNKMIELQTCLCFNEFPFNPHLSRTIPTNI